jgi:hypothetical protein
MHLPSWPPTRPASPGPSPNVIRRGMPEGLISYRHNDGAWLNAAEDHAPAVATPAHSPGLDVEMTPCMALEDLWI